MNSTNLFELVLFMRNSTVNSSYKFPPAFSAADVMKTASSFQLASEVMVIRVYLNNLKIHEWSRPPLGE